MNLLKGLMHNRDTRRKVLWTLGILFILQLGYCIPLPWLNQDYLTELAGAISDKLSGSFLSALTGSSYESMGLFALNIAPYITASIIIELLSALIKPLAALSKQGSVGVEKKNRIMKWMAVGIAMTESCFIAIGLRTNGLFVSDSIIYPIISIITWSAGTFILVTIGEFITKKLIGNGSSLILMFNILSRLPATLSSLLQGLIEERNVAGSIAITVTYLLAIIVMFGYVVLLEDSRRIFPLQSSRRVTTGGYLTGFQSELPIKLTLGGVMPIILSSSVMSMPPLISSFFSTNEDGVWNEILKYMSAENWFNFSDMKYSVGVIVYLLLTFAFSFLYASISFNVEELANNLKRQGEVISGLKPGDETLFYLQKRTRALTFIGAVMLCIVALLPTIASGICGDSSIAYAGTSLIILVDTTLDVFTQIRAKTSSTGYKKILV